MGKCYFDESEGLEQGVRVELTDDGRIIIEQYDALNGKATDTVVLFVEEATRASEAIMEAAADYDRQRQKRRELDRLQRLQSGQGLPGGY